MMRSSGCVRIKLDFLAFSKKKLVCGYQMCSKSSSMLKDCDDMHFFLLASLVFFAPAALVIVASRQHLLAAVRSMHLVDKHAYSYCIQKCVKCSINAAGR